MKIKLALLAALFAGIPVTYAQTASFANFSGMTNGAVAYDAPWVGFGTVHSTVSFLANSNGITTGGVQTPTYVADIQSNLKVFAPTLPGVALSTGRINPVNVDLGYTITWTFKDLADSPAMFPATSAFYIGDQDAGEVVIHAWLAGVPVDVSDMYYAAAQTLVGGTGAAPVWDSLNGKLVATGSSNNFVNQLYLTRNIDTLSFTYQNGSFGDNISYGIGNVLVVPEPVSALALLASAPLLLRRRR